MTSDGFLVIRRPHGLAHLPAPWPEAQAHDEVMIELKLAGNHLDREAVELCARFLPYGYSPAELAGVHYVDGWEFVARCTERYDVVVVDLPDEHPGGAQHNRLYQAEFLLRCKALLTPGGVVARCPD